MCPGGRPGAVLRRHQRGNRDVADQAEPPPGQLYRAAGTPLQHCVPGLEGPDLWQPWWWWHGLVVKEPQRVVPPRAGQHTEIVGVWFKKGHAAQQFGDVIACELLGVAIEKGGGIPVRVCEETLLG